MAFPQLFGVIPTGCNVIIEPSSAPAPTSLIYNLPTRNFSHIVVFLLPGVTLPIDTAAAVYLAISSGNPNPTFKFLGGIGPGKESAIFKVNGLSGANGNYTTGGEVDMDVPEGGASVQELILGISLESVSSVAEQMKALPVSRPPVPTIVEPSNSLVVANQPLRRPDALLLAQRIIKNAFNFLASFSGNINGGVEVVPLKAFEEWWKKFEGRVRSDPGFLERDTE